MATVWLITYRGSKHFLPRDEEDINLVNIRPFFHKKIIFYLPDFTYPWVPQAFGILI